MLRGSEVAAVRWQEMRWREMVCSCCPHLCLAYVGIHAGGRGGCGGEQRNDGAVFKPCCPIWDAASATASQNVLDKKSKIKLLVI